MRDRLERDPRRPVYVISVAASIVRAHPRTLRIYEDEGLLCPARTPTNIRLYSEEDIRRLLWIRHLTQNLGVNLAGVRILFELEERIGTRILEALFDEAADRAAATATAAAAAAPTGPSPTATDPAPTGAPIEPDPMAHQQTNRQAGSVEGAPIGTRRTG
ncbi:MAG: MerR family transcriptional regulator [Candidatus Limnocylindrales bacterium]